MEIYFDYAASNWEVFPVHGIRNGACTCRRGALCSAPGKHPACSRGHKEATSELEKVDKLFREAPAGCNIGLATGAGSKLIVLDVDKRSGGFESLRNLQVPETLMASTGGGGKHYFFVHPGEKIGCSSGTIGNGLDVKGDGGYVVLPPSKHISGREYSWDTVGHPWLADLAACPRWLLQAPAKQQHIKRDGKYWRGLLRQKVEQGGRNNALASIIGKLLRSNLDLETALLLAGSWNNTNCTPPLSDQDVLKTFNSIARKEAIRRGRHQRNR